MATLSKFLFVFLLLGAAIFAAFRGGLVPRDLNPLSPLSLDARDQWFVDFKLAALRRDPALCRALLKRPYVEARPIADKPPENGCGWTNSFELRAIGGAKISVRPLTCEMAAALTLWVLHELQPATMATFGQPVASIEHFGSYSCRNIAGKSRRSEHAMANAIDISGFTLRDSRKVSVLHHWQSPRPEAGLLRQVRRAACRYFRVTLGPDFNVAHADHFHFDRSLYWSCR